jgi:hypothetical protein
MLVGLASQICVAHPFHEGAHPLKLAAILSDEVRFYGLLIPDESEGEIECR